MNIRRAKKFASSALLLSSVAVASGANANVVDITINNATSETLQLVSSYPSGSFPITIAPGEKPVVNLLMPGNRTDIEATYTRVGTGTTCKFTASHIEQITGPYFNKSATPIGTPEAFCSASQTPTWSPPYNYKASFGYYY